MNTHRIQRLLAVMLFATIGVTAVSLTPVSGIAEATMAVTCNGSSTWPECVSATASGTPPHFTASVQGGKFKRGYLVYTRIYVYAVLPSGQWQQIWTDLSSGYANLNGDTPKLSTWIDCQYHIKVVGYSWYANGNVPSVKATASA